MLRLRSSILGSPVTPLTRPATGGAVGGGGAMAGFPGCLAAGHGGQLALDGGGHAETHHGAAAGVVWGWGWVRDGAVGGWELRRISECAKYFLGLGLLGLEVG